MTSKFTNKLNYSEAKLVRPVTPGMECATGSSLCEYQAFYKIVIAYHPKRLSPSTSKPSLFSLSLSLSLALSLPHFHSLDQANKEVTHLCLYTFIQCV